MDVEIKATDCRTLLEALNACVHREIQFTNDLTVLKEVCDGYLRAFPAKFGVLGEFSA